jgi:hypothetical protein
MEDAFGMATAASSTAVCDRAALRDRWNNGEEGG